MYSKCLYLSRTKAFPVVNITGLSVVERELEDPKQAVTSITENLQIIFVYINQITELTSIFTKRTPYNRILVIFLKNPVEFISIPADSNSRARI